MVDHCSLTIVIRINSETIPSTNMFLNSPLFNVCILYSEINYTIYSTIFDVDSIDSTIHVEETQNKATQIVTNIYVGL